MMTVCSCSLHLSLSSACKIKMFLMMRWPVKFIHFMCSFFMDILWYTAGWPSKCDTMAQKCFEPQDLFYHFMVEYLSLLTNVSFFFLSLQKKNGNSILCVSKLSVYKMFTHNLWYCKFCQFAWLVGSVLEFINY